LYDYLTQQYCLLLLFTFLLLYICFHFFSLRINSISLNHTLKGIINLPIRVTSNSQYVLDQIWYDLFLETKFEVSRRFTINPYFLGFILYRQYLSFFRIDYQNIIWCPLLYLSFIVLLFSCSAFLDLGSQCMPMRK
jgi:hypothetical protein